MEHGTVHRRGVRQGRHRQDLLYRRRRGRPGPGRQRVLCLDCDIGLRNLDLALGSHDRALMDFSDVAQGRCSLESAVVEHPKLPGLYLLTAPVRSRGRPVTRAR